MLHPVKEMMITLQGILQHHQILFPALELLFLYITERAVKY